MPVRYMETTSDRSSPLSVEEDNSSDREGRRRAERGTKRKQRNRDAARKSRQKQTERADELHEELQCLERDNTALEKEVKALRKELDYYTSVLERHEPHCCLKTSPTNTTLSTPPRTSNPVTATASSTCSTSSLDLHTTPPPEMFSSKFPLALEQHKPHFCLINKISSTKTTLSNPSYVPPRTSHPVTTPAPFTSSTSSLDLHTTPPPEMFSSKFPLALEQHKPHLCLINKTSSTKTTLSNPSHTTPRMSHPVTASTPSNSSTSSLDLHTTPPPEMFSSRFSPVLHSLFCENPSTIPVYGSFTPTTTANRPKMAERLSQSNICFLTTTSSPLLPCSTLTMSSHASVTIDLPPMGELLAATHPVEGPQSHLDTPVPPQNLYGDPLRDLSLMELLEDNDWILNVQ